MTKPEKILGLLVLLCGFVFQVIARKGLAIDLLEVGIAGLFSALWAVCIFGCWLAWKAGETLYQEEVSRYDQYKPIIHYDGPQLVRRRPSRWGLCFGPLGLSVLFIAVITVSIRLVPPKSFAAKAMLTSPSGFMQFDRTNFVKGYSEIGNGKELRINVYIINHGQGPVLNPVAYTMMMVDHTELGVDKKVLTLFREDWKHLLSDYRAAKANGPESIGVGNGMFGTATLPPMNLDQANGIIRGTLRIYLSKWVAWVDSNKQVFTASECTWLDKPLEDRGVNQVPIWQYCLE